MRKQQLGSLEKLLETDMSAKAAPAYRLKELDVVSNKEQSGRALLMYGLCDSLANTTASKRTRVVTSHRTVCLANKGPNGNGKPVTFR